MIVFSYNCPRNLTPSLLADASEQFFLLLGFVFSSLLVLFSIDNKKDNNMSTVMTNLRWGQDFLSFDKHNNVLVCAFLH